MNKEEFLSQFRKTTLEKIERDRYEDMIRFETESRYPNSLDPCSKFPMDEEIYYRMREDGLYDEKYHFKDNKEVYMIGGKPGWERGTIRDIDNVSKEFDIFGENHNYEHKDWSEETLKKQAELKVRYEEYIDTHKTSLTKDNIPDDVKEFLAGKILESVNEFASKKAFVSIYEIKDKNTGDRTFLSQRDLQRYTHKDNYDITEQKIFSKELKNNIVKYLLRVRPAEYEINRFLNKITDIGGPVLNPHDSSFGIIRSQKPTSSYENRDSKEAWKSGDFFETDKYYVKSMDDLREALKHNSFILSLNMAYNAAKTSIDITKMIEQAGRNAVNNAEDEIPVENNLRYVKGICDFTVVDFNNNGYETYSEDDYEYSEDEYTPIVRIDYKISDIDPHTAFLLDGSTSVSMDIYEGRDYSFSVSKFTPQNLSNKEFTGLEREIEKVFKEQFEKETGFELSDYVDFIVDELNYNDEVPTIEEFKEEYEETLEED